MYDSIMLTLIFLTLLWIACGLQVVASSIRTLGKVFSLRKSVSPLTRAATIKSLERTTMPWLVKMVAVKVISHVVIRYVSKKLR